MALPSCRQHLHGFANVRDQRELVMVGTESLRHHSRILGFIEILACGNPMENVFTGPSCEPEPSGYHDRRVDATAEQRAQGNVRDQTNADGLGQLALQLFEAFFFRLRRMGSVLGDIPILPNRDLSSANSSKCPGRQLRESAETRSADRERNRNRNTAAAPRGSTSASSGATARMALISEPNSKRRPVTEHNAAASCPGGRGPEAERSLRSS